MGRLHRVLDDREDLCRYLIELNIVTEASAEGSQGAGGIVLAPIKAAVYEGLDAATQRMEQGGNGEGRDGNREPRSLTGYDAKERLKGHDSTHVQQGETRSQKGVNEGAVDQHIHVPQPVAQHGHADRHRKQEE